MMQWKIDGSWSLFLDRDGVINQRNFQGYITSASEFKFSKNALSAFPLLSTLFKNVIVVTNQQGVGKKLMSLRNLEEVHRYMLQEISKNKGRVDAIYFADNLKGVSPDRRKPGSAMALEAKKQFPSICFEKSIMVGDTDSDLRFGMNLGMKTVLVKSKEPTTLVPDLEVNDLLELAEILKMNYE